MRCKIDGGMMRHLGQEGYTDRWKCLKCKVVWQLEPRGDVDTDKEVLISLIRQKAKEMEAGK